jgi:hypothetical protein
LKVLTPAGAPELTIFWLIYVVLVLTTNSPGENPVSLSN